MNQQLEFSKGAWRLLETAKEQRDSSAAVVGFASDALLEATGPDAVNDWYEGGRERYVSKLAELLMDGDNEALGAYIRQHAIPYLNDVARIWEIE